MVKIKRSGKFHSDAIPNKRAACMFRARINPLAVEQIGMVPRAAK
jgi:hypothetical protein